MCPGHHGRYRDCPECGPADPLPVPVSNDPEKKLLEGLHDQMSELTKVEEFMKWAEGRRARSTKRPLLEALEDHRTEIRKELGGTLLDRAKTLILAAVLAATMTAPAQAFDLKNFSIKTVKVPVKTGRITILAAKHLGLFAYGVALIVKDKTVEGAHWTGLEFLDRLSKLKDEASAI